MNDVVTPEPPEPPPATRIPRISRAKIIFATAMLLLFTTMGILGNRVFRERRGPAGTASITLARTNGTAGQVSALVSVTGGTATQGQDFTLTWFIRGGIEHAIGHNRTVSAGILYQHMSNGGQTKPNPGIDALGFSVGYSWK